MRKKFIRYFIAAAVVSLIYFTIYVSVQQVFRSSANDPQLQIAQDLANALEKGKQPYDVIPNEDKIDISKSLSPFIAIYDDMGKPVVWTGEIDGKPPTLPPGVYDFTRENVEDRITWQSKEGLRNAIVMRHYKGPLGSGFVMAGRSLRETEQRVDQLSLRTSLAWIASLAVLTFLLFT